MDLTKALFICSSIFFLPLTHAVDDPEKILPVKLFNIKRTNNTSAQLPEWGNKNLEVISNNLVSEHADKEFLRVHFPAGSANPSSSPPLPLGGSQFYYPLLNTDGPVTLSYFIRFPKEFPFDAIKRSHTLGKLPGLYAGKGNTGRHIPTGTDGWSTRFMWCDYNEETKEKVRAGGEVLLFTPGSDKGKYGHSYGTHLGCGNWKFANDNQWHHIQQTIHLNTPGVANGRVDVCYDGQLVLTKNDVLFRTSPDLKITGILFQTFFGGDGPEYAAPINTYIDFANFALYNYPENNSPGPCIKKTP